ncbi:MAG TPA: hypothetical protein DDW45_07465 [Gammaproteobacteria bacterium]|nr:hypothetical protein [Gammaproteobacteria bacterium]
MHKIDENSTSASHLGSWVKKALCGGAVVSLAMTMGAQSAMAGAPVTKQGFKHFTPFSRVAMMPVVRGAKGQIDYEATYDKANAAAVAVAHYLVENIESETLGADVIQGYDWKLGGESDELPNTFGETNEDFEIADTILRIPTPERINPNLPASKANTLKTNVIEFCNKKYASMALGVAPIVDDNKVVNGYTHAPALPCEVSIWNDDKHIYVDMLDPSAIFTLFFTDVLLSDDMNDRDFADAITAMPPQVKSEIKAILYEVLSNFDPDLDTMDKAMGPRYTSMDQTLAAVDAAPEDSPFLHIAYTKTGGGTFTADDSIEVAQTIINTMSKETGTPGIHPTVIDVDEDGNDVTLDSILSEKSSWRSGRLTPITIPGKNHVIEACSPKYAKMAMGTGAHHVTALPCEITVQIIDREGDGVKESLVISYLDPHFMLGALFADVELTEDQQTEFTTAANNIKSDLQKVVAAALDVNSDLDLNYGVQISYDMLPQDD